MQNIQLTYTIQIYRHARFDWFLFVVLPYIWSNVYFWYKMKYNCNNSFYISYSIIMRLWYLIYFLHYKWFIDYNKYFWLNLGLDNKGKFWNEDRDIFFYTQVMIVVQNTHKVVFKQTYIISHPKYRPTFLAKFLRKRSIKKMNMTNILWFNYI